MSNANLTKQDYKSWIANPLTKALKQSHQDEVDAIVQDSDKAFDLLRRAETEMRYAMWAVELKDNVGRNAILKDIQEFLK
jgi:hypothetical protein